MADGKWVMTEEDSRRVDLSYGGSGNNSLRELPNYGKNIAVDNRNGEAPVICAFCGNVELLSGFGGMGEGFGYKSYKCPVCGGTSDFVYKDETGRFFSNK